LDLQNKLTVYLSVSCLNLNTDFVFTYQKCVFVIRQAHLRALVVVRNRSWGG